MTSYKVLQVVSLPAGTVLKLTKDQVRRRKHNLKALKAPGMFTAKDSLQFKVGEIVEIHGKPDNIIKGSLLDMSEAPAEAPDEAHSDEEGDAGAIEPEQEEEAPAEEPEQPATGRKKK